VWRAERVADGRVVAIKVLGHAASAPDTDQALREFAVLQRVRVEGLVGFHEVLALDDAVGSLALVLDHVDGGSLASVVAARGHLTPGEAVTVASPIARTLSGLHQVGVVHGDVTPGNVLLERSGRPVLADLGVARLVGEAPGELFGTEGFTAPEVEAGALPTSASDVYAVGALVWWCVTGEAPPPVPLRRPLAELVPWLGADFVTAVERCLAGQPQARPSAAEAALQLFDAASCEPLRLVLGHDEVALITRRIRSGAPLPEPREVSTTWVTRAVGGVAASARSSKHLTRRILRDRALRPVAVLVSGVLASAAVLGGVAVAGAAIPGQAPDGAPRAGGAGASSGTSTAGTAPSVAAKGGAPSAGDASVVRPRAEVRRAPTAPATDPRALMQELSGVRAGLMSSGDPKALDDLDVPGSIAWAADAALLEEVAESGRRFQQVAFTVRSARALTARGGHAQVEAVVDTAAHEVIGPDGRTTSRPPEAGRPMVFHLRWGDGLWRVERVSMPTT
jgi:hypothetical protein